MVYELDDISKVESIFYGWEETLIYSCLQNVMGKIYVTDKSNPKSAMAYAGCFAFVAGEVDKELIRNKPEGFVIMTPQNEAWGKAIEEVFPDSIKRTRYAIKKNTLFDRPYLQSLVDRLPDGYKLKNIDSEIYDMCLLNPVFSDFVSSFASKEHYLKMGRGTVIIKDGRIVSGASSYTRYKDGIEIEVDTEESERRKGLATICCAKLILECLDEGLYPSWDAQNLGSVELAKKIGYEYDHAYIVYELIDTN